jgi:two-component system, OmpR family, sensor histidine kinase CiaH
MKIAGALRPALRVAGAATLAVAILYVVLVVGLVTLMSQKLTRETDARLAERLATARQLPATALGSQESRQRDADEAPVYLWKVEANGAVATSSASAPAFPSDVLKPHQAFPRTISVGGRDFRFGETTATDGSRVFAAQSLAEEHHVRSVVITSAFLVSPILLGGVFASAFAIGRQASKPVEQARRRQLEFTADASHELRTPLTVIEAEVGLALAGQRTSAGYRDALTRIAGESARLRAIVEDLLWLARFDAEPPPPKAELVDLPTIVRQCVDRFEPVLRSRNVGLCVEVGGEAEAQIAAPPEWIDRLVGVLVDNAIRYANSPGQVAVTVASSAAHVALSVADDGPGIRREDRARLFDRFHRVDDSGGPGAGLGLAIGDAVVRSTHGRWTVSEADIGGACMTVTWPRPRQHTETVTHPAADVRPDGELTAD